MKSTLVLGLFAAGSLPLSLPAHGGQYRGPGLPSGPSPVGPSGPAQPAVPPPATPATGTPNTGAGPSIPDEASWQVWWELNKDPFVQQRSGPRGPTTGSDDFYLGQRRAEPWVDTLLATDVDLRDRIVPALVALMEAETNRDIQTACLMALGKLGGTVPGVDLDRLIGKRIARDDQEVRETAALALGVAGRPTALPMLLSLLRNDADGKRLCQKEDVGDRTRAFAAYGLGLLIRRDSDAGHKQEAHDTLWALLNDRELQHRDLRTAVVSALGLLCDPARGSHKRLAWQTVDELLAWYQRDLGRGDEAIQAHAPVAIARLLGRGASTTHRRCKDHFAAVLTADNKRSNPILQSAALALGMLGLPTESEPDDAAVSKALQVYWEKGHDRLARAFAIAALGRIGGAANRAWLLAAYQRGNRSLERPWAALSLGLIAAASAANGEVDTTFAHLLMDDLPEARKPDGMSALAVALGLTGHQPAATTMTKALRENEHDEMLAGYLCIGLALTGDSAAVPTLTSVLERSQRRPFLLLQSAVGLGRLGDRAANDRLLAMLQKSESVAVLSALANAIGQIGDRRAIDPLIAMTKDQELTKLARAFVAAALGGVGDRSTVPWNLPFSRDCNYGAPVDTLSNGSTGVLDIL
ncbi:MAG: HEAT repeat domain-containing protein [Planctomycetota bacterium]